MDDLFRGADVTVSNEIYKSIYDSARVTVMEVLKKAPLRKGDIFVVGCSSSEITGSNIGHGSSFQAAAAVFDAIFPILSENNIYLAAQCCEHLNRAIVIERKCAEKYGYDEVSVKPVPKAGGSFATIAFERMSDSVVVEFIKANAGIDIGGTLIGMHLKHVAVPLRVSINKIGQANVLCAFTRPKLIGGCRAEYKI